MEETERNEKEMQVTDITDGRCGSILVDGAKCAELHGWYHGCPEIYLVLKEGSVEVYRSKRRDFAAVVAYRLSEFFGEDVTKERVLRYIKWDFICTRKGRKAYALKTEAATEKKIETPRTRTGRKAHGLKTTNRPQIKFMDTFIADIFNGVKTVTRRVHEKREGSYTAVAPKLGPFAVITVTSVKKEHLSALADRSYFRSEMKKEGLGDHLTRAAFIEVLARLNKKEFLLSSMISNDPNDLDVILEEIRYNIGSDRWDCVDEMTPMLYRLEFRLEKRLLAALPGV